MGTIDEFTAQIRRAAIEDYHAFMAIDAISAEIRTFLAHECPEIHVDWASPLKSDIADAYALREYGFTDDHLDKLGKRFGNRKEKLAALQNEYGTRGARRMLKQMKSTG